MGSSVEDEKGGMHWLLILAMLSSSKQAACTNGIKGVATSLVVGKLVVGKLVEFTKSPLTIRPVIVMLCKRIG
ncbi:unnamed protein product [Heligmosomoides polygyrus]|uniref:Secreted protein n=1 Tax=Heligmosomoides polygyrus TaxID=6339 RepID=A0A183GGX8_HELPZ|nr:unnamed protein product [Heligmosomoides polygyrus]